MIRFVMIKALEDILTRATSWPKEAQEQLARAAHDIERQHTGLAATTFAERALIDEGLAEADRGEFVSDADMEKFWRRNAITKARSRPA
jgi:predicted transcriptional regulator